MTIIDVHCHLGNILYPGGGSLIDKKGINNHRGFDPVTIFEKGLMRTYGLGSLPAKMLEPWAIKAERKRNLTATVENMVKSMAVAGISCSVCMPIAPYVTFNDLYNVSQRNDRIIPFTSVDFSDDNIAAKLEADVARGARGLKLHPIIQKISLTDQRTSEVLEKFAAYNKPVLVHAGVHRYYPYCEMNSKIVNYGRADNVEVIVKNFPQIKFIVGHAGLFEIDRVIKTLRNCDNVWVDTSFQSPANIIKLVRNFGNNKVLYASDWPYGNYKPAIKTVEVACKDDLYLRDNILYRNAKKLLGL